MMYDSLIKYFNSYTTLSLSDPEFLQRFPQHITASYLGINRETLSRIRSRGLKK